MSGDLGAAILRAIAGLIDLQRRSEPEGYRIFTIG